MSARPLIIDCDPGQDDAVALLLAFASAEEFELLGITAVAGNVPLSRTESNARRIRDLAGRSEVPVYAGCPRPMVREPETAEYIHGATGIDGADLPEPSGPAEAAHAVDFLVDTLSTAREPITLATLGPLTNVALAIVKNPAICANVREIVTMGGGHRTRQRHTGGRIQRPRRPPRRARGIRGGGAAHHGRARRHPSGDRDAAPAGGDPCARHRAGGCGLRHARPLR